MFAVLAFSWLVASAAFAEEVPQWLINGESILLGESFDADILPHESPNELILLFEDTAAPGAPDILCEIANTLEWLLPNGEDLLVSLECLNAEDMKGTCESAAPINFTLANLPWTTQLLEPVTNLFVDDITAGTGGNPGWTFKCRVLFVTITDTCTTTTGDAEVTNVADGLVLGVFDEAVTALCTLNNTETGLVGGPFFVHALSPTGVLLPLAVSLATGEGKEEELLEEELLGGEIAQWLINGEPILLGESFDADILPHESPNELILLEDTSQPGTPDLLCEIANALEWLLPNGEDLLVSLQCLNVEDMKGTCEAAAPITFTLLNLPWTTQLLEPAGGLFVDDVTTGTGGNPGWSIKCRVLFVTVTDSCTTAAGDAEVTNVADGLVLGVFDEAVTALCTLNNTETGLVGGPFFIHALSPTEMLLPLAVSLGAEQP
jgi:hypothetical protein